MVDTEEQATKYRGRKQNAQEKNQTDAQEQDGKIKENQDSRYLGYSLISPCPLSPNPDSQACENGSPARFLYCADTSAFRDADICIWSPSYPPDTPVPLNQAATSHPGGLVGFKEWAKAQMSITPRETLLGHQGVDDIWKKFTSCFLVTSGLFYTEPIFRRCIRQLLSRLQEDGIRYAELRISLVQPFQQDGQVHGDPHFTYLLECLHQELVAFMASARPGDSAFWGLRLIWAVVRSLPENSIRESLEACIALKRLYPDLLCGVDFVGQEDRGSPLSTLMPICVWFRQRCTQEGIELPFVFHAGECLGDGNSTDWNLADAILLRSRRIGHGVSLYKHPLLMQKVVENDILIETCPISHQVLRLTSSALTHPLAALLSRGVATSLSNDDPGMLGHGYSGLGHDFLQVLLASDNVKLAGLADMVENSIKWALFEDQSHNEWAQGFRASEGCVGLKLDRLMEWKADFTKWCEWVVDRFGTGTER
ncbi:hypothetical protein BDW74DRAFT_173670 [Aspergillus multicolor]|uniref:uncharacterized protein n=1 Tax=Aspergillus multicolor TaxID=41759 RepID=UPI003CCD82B8